MKRANGDCTFIICDRCGASVGGDFVTLNISAPGLKDNRDYNGYIAHYHPECFDEVHGDIEDAADRMPAPAPDSVVALNAIATVSDRRISELRDQHRRVGDGRRVWEAKSELHGLLRSIGLDRVFYDLERLRIASVEDLAAIPDIELCAIRGIGPKTVEAIRRVAPQTRECV